jgi:hypothetical protein
MLKKFIQNKTNHYVAKTMNYSAAGEFDKDDVFIVGYPKSGNTWFRFLVAGVVYGVDLNYAPSHLVYDLVPDIHYLPFYKRYQTPMYFKSHHLPRPEYRKAIYLLRDGRDVMVSYLHHLTAIKGESILLSDLVENKIKLPFGPWHVHVESWMQNPYDANIMTIRYENLINQPLNELHRFCEFLGIEREDSLLTQVIEKSSFASLQKKENEIQNFGETTRWPGTKNFFRRGKIGSYKDEMSPEILNMFMEKAGQTLRKYGYLD